MQKNKAIVWLKREIRKKEYLASGHNQKVTKSLLANATEKNIITIFDRVNIRC